MTTEICANPPERLIRTTLRTAILASATEEGRAKLVAQWEKEDADAALLVHRFDYAGRG